MTHAEFSLPAIRGIQAGRPFFTTMCSVPLLLRLFPVRADGAMNDGRTSFRKVNKPRARNIAKEIVDRRGAFHLAAITISVEDDVRFVRQGGSSPKQSAQGRLIISVEAPLIVIDGLHRLCGLHQALPACPELNSNCIAVVVHVDPNGSRRGEIYSDLKRFERSTAQSLRIGVDERDELAKLTRSLTVVVPAFRDAIEFEKTAISNRSRKLFTLSALYHANRVLLADVGDRTYEQRLALAAEFWSEVARHTPLWSEIAKGCVSAAEIRAQYVHCHAIGIAAIARAGRDLLAQAPRGWRKRLAKLSSLDWSRQNVECWEGRAMIGGRLSKSSTAVARTGNVVKQHLGLKLSREDRAMEETPFDTFTSSP